MVIAPGKLHECLGLGSVNPDRVHLPSCLGATGSSRSADSDSKTRGFSFCALGNLFVVIH